MDIKLMQICWEDYIKLRPPTRKAVGYPAYYTINPDTGRCIIWPTPAEGVQIIARVEGKE